VKTSLIKTRRIIFTPAVDLKEELANTAIQITCYDRDGNEVKRVTSADDGTVEDPENEGGGSSTGSDTGGGDNGGGSSTGSDTGGDNNGGGNGGGNGDDY
jgi:hypothetical protein